MVPCFNEAARLDTERFGDLANRDDLDLMFVDDGSSDGTRDVLESFAAGHPGTSVQVFDENRGKAEAVRSGLQAAVATGADIVGYYDADLASPPGELLRLLAAVRSSDVEVVMAARVALLGRTIERHAVRHYTGRVFATVASMILRLPVYDTQCGLKLFRVTPSLEAAIGSPFSSRWSFDVELLDRLIRGGTPVERIVEEPLLEWRDVPGSKLGFWARARAGLALLWYGIRRGRR